MNWLSMLKTLFVFVFVALVIRLSISIATKWFRFLKLSYKLSGPSTWLLLKNLPRFTDEMLSYAIYFCRMYEFKPFRLSLFGNIAVVLSDPHDITAAFKSKSMTDKPSFYYSEFAHFIGENLVTLNGEVWKRHRRALNPALSQLASESYLPVLNSEARRTVKDLAKFGPGKSFDIHHHMQSNQLHSSGEVMSRHDLLPENILEILDGVEGGSNIIHLKFMNPLRYYLFERFGKQFQKSCQVIMKCMKTFKEMLDKRKEKVELQIEDGSFTPSCLFDHLLLLKQEGRLPLSEEELLTELFTLFLGGAETTALSNSAAMGLIALHPDVQSKIMEEQYSIFGSSDRLVTTEDLRSMVYLECVIKEAFRLFPPIPIILRTAKDENYINGVLVPQGSIIGVCLYALQRNAVYFKQPRKFCPERFLPDNSDQVQECGFMPFSSGPRKCIGARYAMLVMKTFLSTVLRKYEIRPGEGLNSMADMKITVRFTLRFPKGIQIRLYPRKLNNNDSINESCTKTS